MIKRLNAITFVLFKGGLLKDTNYIFNTTKLADMPRRYGFLSAIVTESRNDIGALIGTPCIVNKRQFEMGNSKLITAVFPFPFLHGKQPNSCYGISRRQVKAIGESIIGTHKTKDIESFDFNRIEDLSDYVNEYGSITFRFSEYGCPYSGAVFMRRFIEALPKFVQTYKNHTVQEMTYYSNSIPNFDTLSCHITFMNIRHCLPVFSAAKSVRGLALIIKIGSDYLYRKIGRNVDYFTLSMLFSNKLKGVFCIDGIQLNSINALRKPAISKLDTWISKVLEKKIERKRKGGTNKAAKDITHEPANGSETTKSYCKISNFQTFFAGGISTSTS